MAVLEEAGFRAGGIYFPERAGFFIPAIRELIEKEEDVTFYLTRCCLFGYEVFDTNAPRLLHQRSLYDGEILLQIP
jgi:hypothetical protein